MRNTFEALQAQVNYGKGSFVGASLNGPDFYELSTRDQALLLGWAVGCPVADELTNPLNSEPGRGPEAMVARYGEVGFWFGYITRAVHEVSPDLYAQLTTPVKRWDDEAVGEYERGSVPISYRHEIPPTETLAGYTLPRIFIKQLGKDLPVEEAQARLFRGLEVLNQAIPQAQTPEELLALVAEGLSQADVPPLVVLSSALPVGWFEEQNAGRTLATAKAAFREKASKLWSVYEELSSQGKIEQGILQSSK